MDPVTIIGGATMAFNALKKGFAIGKDLQDMSGQLSQWANAMSDLGQAEKQANNPPWWKALGGSVEAEAMEVFAAKRKAESMREELRQFISWNLGPSAWDELLAIEAKIRKQKKEHEYRKAEIKESIITWTLSALLFIVCSALLVGLVWFLQNV